MNPIILDRALGILGMVVALIGVNLYPKMEKPGRRWQPFFVCMLIVVVGVALSGFALRNWGFKH